MDLFNQTIDVVRMFNSPLMKDKPNLLIERMNELLKKLDERFISDAPGAVRACSDNAYYAAALNRYKNTSSMDKLENFELDLEYWSDRWNVFRVEACKRLWLGQIEPLIKELV